MILKRAIFLTALLVSMAGTAQTPNPYNGNWTATWEGTQGVHHHVNQADVVILDNGGTFRNLTSSNRNPCVGRTAPVTVKTATEDTLIFVVEFSAVLKGCRDVAVRLKRVDDRTLKGVRDADKEITLIRK